MALIPVRGSELFFGANSCEERRLRCLMRALEPWTKINEFIRKLLALEEESSS